ncbi:MAG: 6-carboxytetrahydropterin synthase [Zestosphaera sp.]
MGLEGKVIKDCVSDFTFDAAHYTPVSGEPLLHGHTFKVEVCVEGRSGSLWVADFIELRNIVRGLIEPLNYSLLVPSRHAGKILFNAPFKIKERTFECMSVTAECIGSHICSELRQIYRDEGQRIMVIIEEGVGNKAVTKC